MANSIQNLNFKKKIIIGMILLMRSENCHQLLMEIKQSADTNYASSK